MRGEENVSTTRCVIIHEWILRYDWYICLAIDDHNQETYKGEDQNNDLSYGQLDHNVGIFDFELK